MIMKVVACDRCNRISRMDLKKTSQLAISKTDETATRYDLCGRCLAEVVALITATQRENPKYVFDESD